MIFTVNNTFNPVLVYYCSFVGVYISVVDTKSGGKRDTHANNRVTLLRERLIAWISWIHTLATNYTLISLVELNELLLLLTLLVYGPTLLWTTINL